MFLTVALLGIECIALLDATAAEASTQPKEAQAGACRDSGPE